MSCETNANKISIAAAANGIPKTAVKAAYATGAGLRVTPAIRVEAQTRRTARITVSPLKPGYGVTLGNALRRTLLSDIAGAAITAVKVDGVPHEFTTLPHVREDMTSFILNLKAVRLKFKEDKPATFRLNLRGEGEFKAGDLQLPPHVEVVNPDLVLLTGDSDAARVDAELTATTGSGFSPPEERAGLSRGEIAIDAVFSPVRKAGFKLLRPAASEIARHGRPFERLQLEVETDGTITPADAIRQAAQKLSVHFSLLTGDWQPAKTSRELPYHRSLDELGLDTRTRNALRNAGLTDVLSIMKELRRGDERVKSIKGLGEKSLASLLKTLETLNLSSGDKEVLQYYQIIQKAKDKRQNDDPNNT